MRRVAALYDIHGNLPALEAVLQEVRRAGIDAIVVGGDVLPGPMPRQTLDLLLGLDVPTRFIFGNGDRAILAQLAGARTGAVTYWGTTSGKRPPEDVVGIYRWTATQVADLEPVLASWPMTVRLAIDGLGETLFCHSTPRSETEAFTRLTAEEHLLPIFEPLGVAVVVCGHTHMQFDRAVGTTRIVNAGSVGAPFGEPAACWLLLGPAVELRRTPYDLDAAAERIRRSDYPQAESFAAQSVLAPPSEEAMLETFSRFELRP
jgi:predicted phosphodiesterase